MIVFRALFWLAVAIVLVPADVFEAAQTKFYEVAPIVVSAMGEQVADALLDATDSCTSRPQLCDAARDFFSATSSRLESAPDDAKLLPATHDEAI